MQQESMVNIEKEVTRVEEMANELGLEILGVQMVDVNMTRFRFVNTLLYLVMHHTKTDVNIDDVADVKYSVRTIIYDDHLNEIFVDISKALRYIRLNHKYKT